jgi:aspartyl/asparaginyl-tRNA synthetase
MQPTVKDMSIEDLQQLISETVKNTISETLEDLMEDIAALSSDNFQNSIKKARKDYEDGNYKSLEELIDV